MKKVSVICIDCKADDIDLMVGRQTYPNLEVVEAVTGKDFYQDIADYCEHTDSDYISFWESGQWMGPDKIKDMVEYAEEMEQAEVILCYRNYAKADGTVVAYPDRNYRGRFQDRFFENPRILYENILASGRNILGNLTTVMFRKEKVKLCMEHLKQYGVEGNPEMQKTFLLFEILANGALCVLEKPLVCTFVQELDVERLKYQEKLFEGQLAVFFRLHGWEVKEPVSGIAWVHNELFQETAARDRGIERKITFFATDKGEYYNLLPLMREAEERGYSVKYTDDLDEKAEIGVYCQHFGKPQNAKFSVVLLHDMAQGHNRWPNIWEAEHWCEYDIGIVPGMRWKERWETCAFDYHAYPRCGAYMLGYPKSQEIYSPELKRRAKQLKESMNLKYDISVLYAPSWENDKKEDDFVRALSSLPVNLLVKQAPWPETYAQIVKNIQDMRSLHEGKYENLYYINPEESIMTALDMCDLIVSDESSVMIEGAMFGKPALAVCDWLIPDVEPSRFASIPYEDVYKCKKAQLRETVEKLIASGLEGNETARKAGEFFANKEHVNRDILDAIEYFTTGTGRTEFMKWKMSCRYMPINMWS